MFDDLVAKDFYGPALGVLGTVLVGIIGLLGKWMMAKDGDQRLAAHDARMAQSSLDAAQATSIADRFKALMEGYEGRVRDLTTEINSLRDEVKKVRQALDLRTQVCAGCPNYAAWIKEHKNAEPAS